MTNSPQITASHFQQNQQPMKDNPVQDVKDKKERKRKCISNTYKARHKSIFCKLFLVQANLSVI